MVLDSKKGTLEEQSLGNKMISNVFVSTLGMAMGIASQHECLFPRRVLAH